MLRWKGNRAVDPLSAALQLQSSINALLTALINKASASGVDAMILAHEARLAKVEAFIEFLIGRLGYHPPTTPPTA